MKVADTGSFMTAVPSSCHPSSMEMQKSLDKLRQRPYHETEAIYLSSQSVQVNDKKLRVFGVSCLIFR
ncbi:MAG: hypothetical protein ACEY3F_01845, partial [Wolbachia sp.]